MEIIVEGKGVEYFTPDQVVLNIEFHTKGLSYEEALSEGVKNVQNFVSELLLRNGFNNEDMKTRSFVVREDKKYNESTRTYIFDGYLFNQSATIKFDYDKVWSHVLNDPDVFKKIIPCAFTNWDNTSRHGIRGSVITGETPDKFENYLKQLILKAKQKYETDLMFIFAWNEWAEGGYLEPDEENGFGYLEAIKKALEETGEFPSFDDN